MSKHALSGSVFAAIGLLLAGAQNLVSSGQLISNNTPKFAATARNLGPENPSAIIDVSIWLNLHNRSEMDSLAKELYDAKSPNFQHWLSKEDFAARFAPTAQEAKIVEDFFTTHNLKVVAVGPDNFFVRARGTVADVNKAFRVEMNRFEVNGQIYRSNTSDPYVEGPAGALVRAVYGLDNLEFKHPIVTRPTSLQGNGALTPLASAEGHADPWFFTNNCFTGPKTEMYTTGGGFPIATYTGNGYNGTNNIAGCGYIPADIQTAYKLNALYREGFDGSGQTIVIIDWCGSPTITGDANAFSARFGLPPLTSSNFNIVEFPTPSTCAAPDVEINLDVEWAHAVAPGANIELVVPPSASFQDVDTALLFAVVSQFGNVISGSYESPEHLTPANVLINENLINQAAALLGISNNFASGDYGDFTVLGIPATVSAPADSPYATGIGGVTLALNPNRSIAFQAGWGNNQTLLINGGSIFDPPLSFGFYAGSGGGPSAFFAKPGYQAAAGLPGTTRQIPDISWLADPFTGVVIAITEAFIYPPLIYEAIGGTSLSCPMFSALWAIANQEAGFPLGQAAPYLYFMPPGTITDIVPYGSATNVTASIQESSVITHNYSADQLAAPLNGTTTFYSTLWDIPLTQDTTFVITFGTDSSLKTATGWDNVTGVGVPNPKAFADAFSLLGPSSK